VRVRVAERSLQEEKKQVGKRRKDLGLPSQRETNATKPWAKVHLMALHIDDSLSFTASRKHMRAIRKSASVVGEDNERKFAVEHKDEVYTIRRVG